MKLPLVPVLGLLLCFQSAVRATDASQVQTAYPRAEARAFPGMSSGSLFSSGLDAYRAGDFARAADAFRECARQQPSAGALQNLGNAEWRRDRVGHAIVAWERALWIDPKDARSRNNLRFVREQAQIEAPELAWHEIASSWLPHTWWAWITAVSLWFTSGLTILPAALRWRRAGWHHAGAALALGVFLLTIPAQLGAHSRSRIGFVLERDTLLRLTPTAEGEAISRLGAGDPVRVVRAQGNYVFVRTTRLKGWLAAGEFALVCR